MAEALERGALIELSGWSAIVTNWAYPLYCTSAVFAALKQAMLNDGAEFQEMRSEICHCAKSRLAADPCAAAASRLWFSSSIGSCRVELQLACVSLANRPPVLVLGLASESLPLPGTGAPSATSSLVAARLAAVPALAGTQARPSDLPVPAHAERDSAFLRIVRALRGGRSS